MPGEIISPRVPHAVTAGVPILARHGSSPWLRDSCEKPLQLPLTAVEPQRTAAPITGSKITLAPRDNSHAERIPATLASIA